MAEKMTETVASVWMSPQVLVPAISVLVASVIIPLLIHWLKGRREFSIKIFELRKEAYTKYFEKYEKAAEGLAQDYKEFSQITLKEEFQKLLESDSSSQAIVNFSEAIGKFPEKIQSSYSKATEQVTNLKIIGSNELLELVKKFECLNKEMLEMSSEWLSEMQGSLTMPDFNSPVAEKLKQKGLRAQILKEEIIAQMRKELASDRY